MVTQSCEYTKTTVVYILRLNFCYVKYTWMKGIIKKKLQPVQSSFCIKQTYLRTIITSKVTIKLFTEYKGLPH